MAAKKPKPDDAREKASRKPIPKTLDGWEREVQGVERFVRAKPGLVDVNGAKWFNTMLGYYKARLSVLKANKPAGLGREAAAKIVGRVEKLLG